MECLAVNVLIFGGAIVSRILYYLNYPFINQEQYKVSLLSLLLLVAIIAAATVVSRYVRRFLQKRVLPRSSIEIGMQYTLLRIVHYLIIVAGVLYALKMGLSIDLTSIAVILGFLSVGIGFGLQYVASDVISGLILLFERPIRVGDRIKVEDMEGRVESISVRATLVITNDNMAVIVPNSVLIRNKFTNWSYGKKNVRLRVPVAVPHGGEVDKITNALLEAGRSVAEVLRIPAPRVNFVEIGDTSLKLELLVWINEPHKHAQIRSNINFQVDKVFRQHGIEFSVTQPSGPIMTMRINQDNGEGLALERKH